MSGAVKSNRETQALGERDSALVSAILRINASLDLATVLQDVVDSARALTGARYGAICTVDESGEVSDVVTSGLSTEEKRQFAEWPDARRMFADVREKPGQQSLADLPEYVHERGFTPHLMHSKTFQTTPMRHRGEHVGNFFLAEKADAAEFSAQDEGVLALFASQAATAIVNARSFRREERARANLETVIETSPIGVSVFDVRNGRPVSCNRETRRILEGLEDEDRPLEEVAKELVCRFSNGREVSFAEVPMARALEDTMTLRAEEVEFSVPDGRSVRTLVNATPIREEDGAVVSVVLTMQDLAPLEELERLRAEFLSMVSHELRAPLTSIKGSAAAVLGNASSLPRAEMLQFFRIVDAQADHMQGLIGNLLDAGRIEAGTLSVNPEAWEVLALVEGARHTFLSGGARHTVYIDVAPDLPWVMADRERIVQVLNNLFCNAARHAPEFAPIRVEAAREGVHVAISVRDEGRGVPPEMLGQLFRKHVALAGDDEAGGIGTAGLGLAICKGLVEAHGGRIRAESAGLGQGARFTFTLPIAGAREGSVEAETGAGRTRAPRKNGDKECVLVVDDDPTTLRLVRDELTRAGYTAVVTADPDEIADLIRANKPRLVLLDLMLPGADGIELMSRVPELAELPIIFISGYGRDETIARAFENGAADYIVKPFSPTELVARVAAELRRRATPRQFVLGELVIDYDARKVTLDGRPVSFTATEYEVLRILSVNAGRPVTSESLIRKAWAGRDTAHAGHVRAFVRKLRSKLGDDAANPTYIFNMRGVGYRMAAPEEH